MCSLCAVEGFWWGKSKDCSKLTLTVLYPWGRRWSHSIHMGDQSGKATHFTFTPQLGLLKEWLGKMMGKLPAEFHYDCWNMVDGIPSFVQYEGPLQLLWPIWRIELVSPRLYAKADEETASPR